MTNLYESAARTRKALALFDQARAWHITAAQLAEDDDMREHLVALAAVNPASAATWAVVLTLLEEAEASPPPADPFDVFR